MRQPKFSALFNLKLLFKSYVRLVALVALLLSVQSVVVAQNSPNLFKLSIRVSDTDPTWVKLMYSENPNVWEVEREYSKYYKEHKFEKTTHTQNYKFWKKTIYGNDFIDDDGFLKVPSLEEQRVGREKRMKKWKTREFNQKMSSWTSMGPFETYWENDGTVKASSQVNIYCIDQSISDPNIMYCGTETSSVFKSTDKAQNWVSLTDGLILNGGVHAVKVHPTNPNIVFFGTNSEIYKSINGGANWELVYTEGNMNVNTILIIPGASATEYIVMATGGSVAAGAGGVYRNVNQGNAGSWTKQSNEAGWDLKLKPGSTDIVYLLRSKASDQMVRFFRSTNKGQDFTEQSTGWFAGSSMGIDNTNAGARMAVTVANPEYVYVALLGDDVSRAQDVFWLGVYKSTNGGTSWTLPAGDVGGPYSASHYNLTGFHPVNISPGPTPYQQEYYNLGIGVSATDPERIMVGCLNLFQSTNGAASYQAIGGYVNNVGYSGYRHPDVQEIEINGADIWIASDGGIDKYAADWLSHEALNNGINGSEFWGFDTGWNEDVLIGGRYHNGNAVLYQSYPIGKSREIGGGESGTGYINKGQNRRVHASDSQDRLMPTAIGDALASIPNLGIYPNESNGEPTDAGEVKPDPRCYNHMYLTKDNNIYKSIDGGATFTLLRAFGTDSLQRATRIEVSRSNPQVIYVAQRLVGSSVIWRTTDGGNSWAQIGLPLGINSASGFLLSLSATDQNELYLAIANGGNSNEKVYKTIDGGTSWTNLTTTILDGQRPEQIMHQLGTNGGVYVATNSSVFYRNNTHANWQAFNNGAPADFRSGIIRPFYKESKVRIATENRGIWSSPLFEPSATIAQPMASKLMISCFDEIVQFEDFSILDHTNATWNWTISPTPAFIDNPNIRNPKVRFGAQGTYSVTLKVTNGAGQMSTKTIPNMISVGNTCFCAPCQGCSTFYTKVGVATEDIGACCINLTPNALWQKGGAWHSEKINLSNNVEFKFDLDLGNINGNDADGVAFVLQKADNTAIGEGIGNLGITPSLSVVFKTFGTDRIEIWKDGIDSNISGVAAPSISGSGSHSVTIKWDAMIKRLTVDWENNGIDIIYNNDIIANFFAGDGSNVIWGFTAGTGGFSANHKVCNIMLNVTAGPCPANVTVSTMPVGNTLASATITTQGNINANGALFSAPNVIMNNGFSVEGNQCFEVNNVGCLYTGTLNCIDGGGNVADGSCAAPHILSIETPFMGNTTNGMSNWSGYPNGTNYPNKEVVHTLVVPAMTSRTIRLTGFTNDMDFFVTYACNNTSVISSAGAVKGDGEDEVATIMNNTGADVTYYIIVDGYLGVTGPYTLIYSISE